MDCRFVLLVVLLIGLSSCDVIDAPAVAEPAPTLAPAASPAPTPPAAPPPAVLLERALANRAIGADTAVGDDLSMLLQRYPDAAEARDASYYLAESFARRGRWTSAATLWQPLAAAPPGDELAVAARFWLALAHEAAGDHAAAVAAYAAFRELDTPLAPYAALREGDQLRALGRDAEAAEVYLVAAQAKIAQVEQAGAHERAIAALRAANQPDAALDAFIALTNLAEQPAYRARILAEAITLAEALGRVEQATQWRRTLVVDAPKTPQAADAASVLLQAGDPTLDPAAAAQIFFTAERWSEALSALDQALLRSRDPESGAELRRLRGLALRAQGDVAGALAVLAEAGALNPNGPSGRQAQLDWIQTLGQSGATEQAIQAYEEFTAAYPDDERAPEALNRAIILRERLGDVAGAEAVRITLGQSYAASEQGRTALHRLGLARFQAGDFAAAQGFWRSLTQANSGNRAAQGAFWAGRAAQALGDAAAANSSFAQARSAGPTSYYGARAAEELGEAGGGAVPLAAPPGVTDWAALTEWIAAWHTAEDAPAPEQAAAVERAELLTQVNLTTSARNEWQAALSMAQGDPFALAALARAASAAHATPIGLSAAEALTALVPPDAPPAPVMLQRLLYPVPYADLIIRESAANNVDPRLFLALLRQESRFDPGATSWVGARGLAQVMPATGEGIAANLGVTDFALDDLYRPAVSVRFGTYYLGRRIADMEGSRHGALAAYNGGLGNAMRWAGGTRLADPDLFAEIIDFPETQGYVKLVLGYYGAYRALYAEP
jgi:soluble lytic murein transglycosylase